VAAALDLSFLKNWLPALGEIYPIVLTALYRR
jgi:hypothetical protein